MRHRLHKGGRLFPRGGIKSSAPAAPLTSGLPPRFLASSADTELVDDVEAVEEELDAGAAEEDGVALEPFNLKARPGAGAHAGMGAGGSWVHRGARAFMSAWTRMRS